MGRRILPLLALLVFVSCGEDEPRDTVLPPPDPNDPLSPELAVTNLAEGINERNYERIATLTSNDFEYVCGDPSPPGDSLDIPSTWGIADLARCLHGFIDAPDIEQIRFDPRIRHVDPPPAPGPGADARLVSEDARLEVRMRLPDGETVILRFTGAFALDFRRTDETNQGGRVLWEIVRWQDRESESGTCLLREALSECR